MNEMKERRTRKIGGNYRKVRNKKNQALSRELKSID